MHGGMSERPYLFRELEIAPMHASTPPRQQGRSMVPESPLGTFMQQQFGEDQRRGGGAGSVGAGVGGSSITDKASSIASAGNGLAPVGMMSPLSQLVNGGFTEENDAAGCA